jgi:hypothetical protein
MGLSKQRKGMGSRVAVDDRTVANLIISGQGWAAPEWRDPVLWSVELLAKRLGCLESQVHTNLAKARKTDLRLEIVRMSEPGRVGITGVFHGAGLCWLSAQRCIEQDDFYAVEAGTQRRILLRCTRRVNLELRISGAWTGRYV